MCFVVFSLTILLFSTNRFGMAQITCKPSPMCFLSCSGCTWLYILHFSTEEPLSSSPIYIGDFCAFFHITIPFFFKMSSVPGDFTKLAMILAFLCGKLFQALVEGFGTW